MKPEFDLGAPADQVRARVVVLGDVMMDVTARLSSPIAYGSDTPARISMQPGGSAASTASWLGHIGCPVVFVGCVGDDPFGQTCVDALTRNGVDVRVTRSDARTTGTCLVIVDEGGERTMLPDIGANGDLDAGTVPELRLGAGDHLHLSGYALLNPDTREAAMAALASARAGGATTSLDPASAGPLAASLPAFANAMALVDTLIANEDEARVLSGRADTAGALAVLASRVPLAVVKRGRDGVAAQRGEETWHLPAPRAEAIDSTGAGDAFAAGFLAARDLPIGDALAAGQSLAAQAISRVGGGPPPP